MKILIPLNDGWIYTNPFVALLIEGLKKYHNADITTGVRYFWEDEDKYDIIHVFWPQCLLQEGFEDKTLDDLQRQICIYKNTGVRLVATCLNLAAHYSKDSKLNDSYDLVYVQCDMIFHLAEYSRKIMEKKIPTVKHRILPHHVYDTLYPTIPTKTESKNQLKLDFSKRYILSFGTYRSDEERNFVYQISRNFRQRRDVRFLIPTLYSFPIPLNLKSKIKYALLKIKHKLLYPNIDFGVQFVRDKLPYYFAAADVSLIQRIKILNSGNVPMGLYMGNVVVGTEDACVGDVLRETENPTFNYRDMNSVVDAINKALLLAEHNKGVENHENSKNNWNVKKITDSLYDYYLEATR